LEKLTTAEELFALAADPIVSGRARFLAKKAVWKNLDFAEKQTAQGQLSVEPFHQVSFDFLTKKGRCTCSMRTTFCWHQLGLALYCIENNITLENKFAQSGNNEINFSSDLENLPKEKPRDERLEALAPAFRDLEIWLLDTIQSGLATLAGDKTTLQNTAARANDGKMTSIARQLRLLAASTENDPSFFEKTLERLADFYLAAQTFHRRDVISDSLKYDLMSVAGVRIQKNFILQIGETIRDSWVVLGQTQFAEENLQVRKVWLLGQKTARFALILDYAMENQPFLDDWLTGFVLEGELAFYPSGHPQRAVLKHLELTDKIPSKAAEGFSEFSKMGASFAKALGQQPWLAEFPTILTDCRIVFQKNKFFLLDSADFQTDFAGDLDFGWQLLATSGGQKMSIFGIWNGLFFEPLAHFFDGKWMNLAVTSIFEKTFGGEKNPDFNNFEPE
jgi:hypothetical protein